METLREEAGVTDLHAVHRLDKITSGLLLFAKSPEMAAIFSDMFQNHKIEKYYLALSDRKPKKKQGLIAGDMARSRRSTWKLLKTKKSPAITQFFSQSIAPGLRLFVLRPHSGKTHQLRVALKSIGAPPLGDPLYYKESLLSNEVDRGYLHAYALRFSLGEEDYEFLQMPQSGKYFQDISFTSAMKEMVLPWELPWPSL